MTIYTYSNDNYKHSFDEVFNISNIEQQLLTNIVSATGARRVGRSYNCRCIVCGDSKTNQRKKRGYILTNSKHTGGNQSNYAYYCHNCGYGNSLIGFAKEYFPEEFKFALSTSRIINDNVYEKPYKRKSEDKEPVKNAEPETPKPKDILISDFLDYGIHKLTTPLENEKMEKIRLKIVNYISNRQMPDLSIEKLYFTFSYRETGNLIQNAMCVSEDNWIIHENIPRLITVVQDYDNPDKVLSINGRDITGTSNKKYVIIKTVLEEELSEHTTQLAKVYNLHDIDIDKPVFVVEGQIDSLFLPNSIAVQGGDINSLIYLFKHLIPKRFHNNFMVILDNDNIKDTRKRNIKTIFNDIKCFNWKNIRSCNLHKDINEIIMSGKMTLYELLNEFMDQFHVNTTNEMTNILNLLNYRKSSYDINRL